ITVCDETIFVSSMTLYRQAVSLYVQSLLPCKNLLGNIPNPLTVQPPPGAALQLHDSVDLNKIAA
ncbi:hypothetical protein, partial [Faecalibacterium prausnitzii]|uniref:hypothetical protein n=1 Tax=Faecalibacterium prausnitzii TaxID=853 RepID=UPI0022E1FA04